MERLTIRNSDGSVSQPTSTTIQAVFEKLAAYEDTGMKPEEVKAKCAWADNMCKMLSGIFGDSGVFDFSHIKEIIKAEQEGRLIVLPCKVGDKIYILRGDVRNGYETVKKTHVEEVSFGLGCLNKQMKLYPFYFLTLAEAEAALKGVSEDGK